jgi:SH3 domain-containing YSC84-like protein 1
MKRVYSMLIGLGLILELATCLAFAQQPPPPPPPQPASPSESASPSAGQSGQAVNSPSASPQSPSASPQQEAAPQQNPTEPVVPTPPPQPNAQDPNLPQKEKLEAELSRIQAQEERVEIREKDQRRLQESRAVLSEAMGAKVPIPSTLLQKAKCVIIVPGVKKGAVGFGAKYGRGAMSCRLGPDFTGPWSAPAMYALEGANFGLQIGLQGTDLVLLVMNARGVDSLLGSKFRLGGDAALAAGPIGRNMEASTDLAMRAKILAYSRSHGIFAGVSLDGSTLRPDNRANEVLYGREISARQIVRDGNVVVSRDGAPLIQLLDQSTRIASGNWQGMPR